MNTGAHADEPRVGLAARLRALREATRPLISQGAAGKVLTEPRAQNFVSRVESGEQAPTAEQVRELCRAYGAAPGETRELAQLAEALQTRTTSRLLLNRTGGSRRIQQTINQLHDAAAHVRAFHPGMVLGDLQSDDYIRAVFSGWDPAALALRLERNRASRDNPHRRFTLVMTEGALLWNLAGAEVMAAQCDHIAELSHRSNMDIRLITHREPTGGLSLQHGFTIFDDYGAMVGMTHGTALLTKDQDVRAYRELLDRYARIAATGDTMRAYLAEIAVRYRNS